jgi:hypothetical protein
MIVQRVTTHEHAANKSIMLTVTYDDEVEQCEIEHIFKRCIKCASFVLRAFPIYENGNLYVRAYDDCVIHEKTRQDDCIGFIEKPKGLI